VHKVRKWARRNRAAVGAAAVGLLAILAVLAGSLGWAVRDRTLRREQAVKEADKARADVNRLRREGRWGAALAVAQRAEALLAGSGDPELCRQFTELGRDLDMAGRLEGIRLSQSALKLGKFDFAAADPEYARAFRDYGIDALALAPAQAAALLRARAIPEELAAALDDWAAIRGPTDGAGARRLRALARLADPDPDRNRLRDALEGGDLKALEELATSDQVERLPPSTVVLLADALVDAKARDCAVAVLRRAQRLHPDDFWINEELGSYIGVYQRADAGEAVRFLTASVALRPQSAGAHYDLGFALWRQGKLPEAVDACRRAVQLQPEDPAAHASLGFLLNKWGRRSEGEAECREALRLQPDYAPAHDDLGVILLDQGKLAEAESECREALRLQPGLAPAHNSLGLVLERQGKLAEAEAAYREAIRHRRDYAWAHYDLGQLLARQGNLPEAEAALREAIRLTPDNAYAHWNLGWVLERQGKLSEAEAALREAIRLQPGIADVHRDLGWVLARQGNFGEAEAAYREAIRLQPDNALAHHYLAWLLATSADPRRRNPQEAVASAERAVELAPQDGGCLNTLGAARYRAGDYRGAVTALEKAMGFRDGGDSFDWFFLAMAHWQLGDKDQARQWYAKAVSWMEEHRAKDQELARFRAEAEELLGMKQK
jgi:tetratricopeptide (TPR) repeat protein